MTTSQCILNKQDLINFRFSPCIFKVNHFYWPTNALNFIKLKGSNLRCINVLKDN